MSDPALAAAVANLAKEVRELAAAIREVFGDETAAVAELSDDE
jgi:hypothetical protein